MLVILSNSFFSIVKPAKEKIRMPRKNKGTYLSFSMSYLILKKINPRTGKKKKRPKIKLSFVYKFCFFKKISPSPSPTRRLFSQVFDLFSQAGQICDLPRRLAFILIKNNLLIWKVQVPLDKPSVGAASSREINCRGWKPLLHPIPLVPSG
jgi:hypothetical protein